MTNLRKNVTVLAWGASILGCAALAFAQLSAPVHPPATPPRPPAAPAHLIATAAAAAPAATAPPMHTMSGHGGAAYAPLAASQKASVVNAARAKFGLAPLSEAEAVALKGGVLLTPDAPVFGKNVLTLLSRVLMDEKHGGQIATTRTSYVFQPVPSDDIDAWRRGYVLAEFVTEANRVYVAECAYSSPQALTIKFVVRHGPAGATGPEPTTANAPPDLFFAKDNPAIIPLDTKTNRALLAFRAKGAVAQLVITTYQTTYTPNALSWIGDNNYVAFTGCSLVPLQQ